MTLHSHYTAEHEINRCASSSWRFTDDILYPFGSNIFLLSFLFYAYKKKEEEEEEEEILVERGQCYSQSFDIHFLHRVSSIETRNNRAYNKSRSAYFTFHFA